MMQTITNTACVLFARSHLRAHSDLKASEVLLLASVPFLGEETEVRNLHFLVKVT